MWMSLDVFIAQEPRAGFIRFVETLKAQPTGKLVTLLLVMTSPQQAQVPGFSGPRGMGYLLFACVFYNRTGLICTNSNQDNPILPKHQSANR